jgi:tetratricopeptide (TPR) repeat protein
MNEKSPAAHNNLGLSYFESGQYTDAIDHYAKALKLETSSVHHNNRGLAYYHDGKLEEAKKDFDKAIEMDETDPTIYFNRGNAYLNSKPV